MRPPARAALVGAAIAALVTVPGLGNGTLWDNSETAYGEVAREILLFHDWVVMHLNGAPWFVQPPLYFWIAAALAKIFGTGTVALRLPAALSTIVMGAATGYIVARQAGERRGIYAGVILSTCLMQAVVGRLAIMDATLDMWVTLTIFAWFLAAEDGSDGAFVWGCVAAALGFLTKGPVAPVIAILVFVPYNFWQSRERRLALPGMRAWTLGAVAFLAIVAPWFVALGARTGAHSIVELIGHYTFGRYTATIENQSGPLWYYLPVVILGFFPWIAFFPSAVAYASGSLRSRAAQPGAAATRGLLRLALCWIVVPFVFFSFAKTKLPNYIALEMPALALLVAFYFDEAVRKVRSRSLLVSAGAVPVTIALVAIAVVLFSRDNRLTGDLQGVARDLLFVGGAIFAGSLATLALFARREGRPAGPYVLGGATALAVLFLAVLALPAAERFKPIPTLAAYIRTHRIAGDVVAIQNVSGGNALVFYTRPHVYVLAGPEMKASDDGVDPRSVICAASRVWLVAPIARPAYDPTYGRTRTSVLHAAKAQLYLYGGARCGAATSLQRRRLSR